MDRILTTTSSMYTIATPLWCFNQVTITKLLEIWHLTQYFDLGEFQQSTLNISCLKYPRVQMDKGLSKTWENFHCSRAIAPCIALEDWRLAFLYNDYLHKITESQALKLHLVHNIRDKISMHSINFHNIFFEMSCEKFFLEAIKKSKNWPAFQLSLLIQIKV